MACGQKRLQPAAPSGVYIGVRTPFRLAVLAVAALSIGAYSYATAFDLYGTVLGDIVHSSVVGVAIFALPVLIVAIVNRWWALSIAFVPAAVQIYLHEATDYVYPFHEDLYPALLPLGLIFLLAVAALGSLMRAVFDRVVRAARPPKIS